MLSLKINKDNKVLKIGLSEKIIEVLLAPIYFVPKTKHRILIPYVKHPIIKRYQ